MSRSQRIRVVVAVFVGALSGGVCWLGPAFTPLLWPTFFSPGGLSRVETGELARFNMAVGTISFVIAALAFVYVLVAWARWFVGPGEGEFDSADRLI